MLYEIEYTEQDIQRFERKLNKTPTCWYYCGSLTTKGYGSFSLNQKTIAAHRFAYLIYCGPIGTSFVLHSCDNPTCCNPDHLSLGTQQDNLTDCVLRGRIARGSRNGNAKLSDKDIQQILLLRFLGVNTKSIARQFNVSQSCVLHLQKGENRYAPTGLSI
jgi:hypothetical protein